MSILDQIANPQMADIVGALDAREQRIARDEAKRKEIRMGQLIAQSLPHLKEGSPLREMAETMPREFSAFAKAAGIPLNDGERMQQFVNDTEALYTLAKNDPKEAFDYALNLSEERKEAGLNTAQIDKFIEGMREDPQRTMTGLFMTRKILNRDEEIQDRKLGLEERALDIQEARMMSGADAPSGLREFEGMTEGLSPEEKENARRVALGLAPRAVGSAAITTATQGLTDTVAGSESTIKDATKRAEQEAVNATKTGKEYFDQLQNIQANISNYKEGIRLLREEGASTGVIEKRLPSLKAASQKLDNLRNRLGLDVVSGTTFGALSEAELAMALDTGMPSSLKPAELANWFEERMIAQQRLADVLDGAVQFLSIPGNSLADLRQEQKQSKKEVKAKESQGRNEQNSLSTRDQQALDWAKANPDDPRSAAILRKLGMQ